MASGFFGKLAKRFYDPYFTDNLVEPLHLKIMGAGAALFGGLKTKIVFDLVPRQNYAYCMMKAAEIALEQDVRELIAIEFGVAAGSGLLNMADLGRKIEAETSVAFRVIGLDGGAGLPAPRDYRDHPDLYHTGDYPMVDSEALRARLPSNAELILGDIRENVQRALDIARAGRPIGFVAIDVDYYYSTVDALTLFDGDPSCYLPGVLLYLDDMQLWAHNRWQGELLAISEFNQSHEFRKIDKPHFIKNSRLLRNAHWLDQIFMLHVLDHPVRSRPKRRAPLNR
jgi:hypothetical protein